MKRGTVTVTLVSVAILAGITAALWVWVAGTGTEWEPHAPTDVPSWLTSGLPAIQLWSRTSVDLPLYATQSFMAEGSQLKSLPNALLGQAETELEIDTEGKQPVTVDGAQGWLWYLGPEDLVPLPPEDEPPEESSGERRLYHDIRHHRRAATPGRVRDDGTVDLPEPAGLVSGPAIAVQWNRDGVHYTLIAQDREPVTVDVLLRMANSMEPATRAQHN